MKIQLGEAKIQIPDGKKEATKENNFKYWMTFTLFLLFLLFSIQTMVFSHNIKELEQVCYGWTAKIYM